MTPRTMSETDSSPRARDRSRKYDVVLWGATGFTGKIVAEYLVRHYGDSDLRWALAGRNKSKLEAVRNELRAVRPDAAELALLTGDSHDTASLEAIAKDTTVVCTTVGPYAKYGSELVAACVKHGTDYCDLTGETQFIRRMVDTHHEAAKERGARIVHCCGYDSIPSDLGTLMLQTHMKERHDTRCDRIRFFAGETSGTFSGGTIDSMRNIMEEVGRDPSLRRVLGDPYALNPEGERNGPDRGDQRSVAYVRDLPGWTAPFVMAAVNTRVVRRTNAILGYPYGRDFRYSEAQSFPDGPRGLAIASGFTAGLAAFTAGMVAPPTRKLLGRVLPAPGEGPTREQRERGYFKVRLLGDGITPDGNEVQIRGLVEGQQDPGYGETAKMLSESALCLALDDCGPDVLTSGVLTPASAMGHRLIERLRAAGMTFTVS